MKEAARSVRETKFLWGFLAYSFCLSIALRFLEDSQASIAVLLGGMVFCVILWGWTYWSERRQAYGEELRGADYRGFFEASAAVMLVFDPEDGRIVDVNEMASEWYGWPRSTMRGMHIFDINTSPRETIISRIAAVREGAHDQFRARHRRADGSERDIESLTSSIETGGKPLFFAVITDVTERLRAERALEASERRLAVLMANLPGMAYRCANEADWPMAFVTEGCRDLTGYEPEEVMRDGSITYGDIIHPDDREYVFDSVQAAVSAGTPFRLEYRIIAKGGAVKWVWEQGRAVAGEEGRAYDLEGFITDITERRLAEEELRESENRFRSLVESAPDAIFIQTKGQFSYVNRAAQALFGVDSAEELIGEPVLDWFEAGSREVVGERIHRLNVLRKAVPLREEMVLTRSGGVVEAEVSAIPFVFEGADGALVFARDIRERKQAGTALSVARSHMDTLLDASPLAIFMLDAEGTVIRQNHAAETAFGYSAEEAMGRIPPFVAEDKLEEFQLNIRNVLSGEPLHGREVVRRHKDGHSLTVRLFAAAVPEAPRAPRSILCLIEDVTRQRALESQLNQALKMEAVGQLAGGVAHDFNNILQAILGYGRLMQDAPGSEAEQREAIEEICASAERAASLTQQLLTFSRRQVMRIETVDLNGVVENLLKMLRRVLGEHVRVEYLGGANLGLVRADRGMMEQVVLNLCINSRDAMPGGGVLTIETENVRISEEYSRDHVWAHPGRYVLLTVTDTGSGMDAQTMERIFEPFYTTKEEGIGTGLGLATVYGIVKQHKGMVNVYSELGQGSAFKVYIPLTERNAETVGDKIDGPVRGGHETILLAEDDESVRRLARRILEQAGYKVLCAEDGIEAAALYARHAEEVDLLVLDVVMPHAGGPEALRRVREINPGARAIFSSGYSENAVHTNFVQHEEIVLIRKPYAADNLLRAIREMLDRPAAE